MAFESVEIRQPHVEDDDVRAGGLCFVDGMSTGISGGDVPSLITHGHGEQPSEARLVLNDQDADGGPVSAGESGRLCGECHGLRVSRGKSVLPCVSPVIFL